MSGPMEDFSKQSTRVGRDARASASRSAERPLAFRNRSGDLYYLHEGKTKTGKPRYFAAKTVRDGALATMPAGFEFAESINGVVSVRRIDDSFEPIALADVDSVRAELARHAHLSRHAVEAQREAIVIFEPISGSVTREDLRPFADAVGVDVSAFIRHESKRSPRYDAVMKFERCDSGKQVGYQAYRMTYRGDGGWFPLSFGTLKSLARKYICAIGTDEFYELF